MRSTRLVTALYLSAALLAAFSAGCGKKAGTFTEIGNIPPTVRLTQAPFDDGSAYFYAYRLNWLGYDPDGRVTGYVYAIDPPTLPGAQIPWIATDRNEQIVFFAATQPDPDRPLSRSIDFHTFAIAAIDDDADTSEVVKRSFFSFTTAPTVSILTPRPSSQVNAQLTPAVRISWTGTDPDGQFTSKPIKYKFLLIGPGSEFPVDRAVLDPDSVRRFYAPNFAGWDSTSADTTQVQFTNLTPGQNYIFVVVAFDEAGAYSPLFDLSGNMLRFRVGFAGNNGPKITMFNEFFFFQYASGGYSTDSSREVFIEVPANARVNFNWFAQAAPGSDIQSYRWSLDIPDVADNTPRDDEINDVTRWSAASLLTTSATVGPFAGGEVHRFYIEALDNNGLRSLGIVRFQVVASSLDRPLAIVDDTRFLGDNIQAGTSCVRPPIGAWPTAAELDTFLFARGGHPWRCYPAGTFSQPGLFAGYEFDTIGTRTGLQETVVRLSRLGQYKHVVWIVDAKGATYVGPGSDPAVPITALRYMSSPGRFNALAAYVKQGGRVWLTGAGGAMATTGPWNNPPGNNNDGSGVTFSSTIPELIPGRFMYDLVAWRSEIKVVTVGGFINRLLGRNTGGSTWPGAPDYNRLPVAMRAKSVALDPFPPGRAGQSPSVFYKGTLDAEFLSMPNFILEDLNPDPDLVDEQSVLDTLYHLITFGLPPAGNTQRVTMTYYHGVLSQELVFTGFNIWDYNRADCQSLVDFVLQDIWDLSRTAPASTPATAVRSAARVPSQTVATPAPAVPVGAARPALPRSGRTLSRE